VIESRLEGTKKFSPEETFNNSEIFQELDWLKRQIEYQIENKTTEDYRDVT